MARHGRQNSGTRPQSHAGRAAAHHLAAVQRTWDVPGRVLLPFSAAAALVMVRSLGHLGPCDELSAGGVRAMLRADQITASEHELEREEPGEKADNAAKGHGWSLTGNRRPVKAYGRVSSCPFLSRPFIAVFP